MVSDEKILGEVVRLLEGGFGLLKRAERAKVELQNGSYEPETDAPLDIHAECQARLGTLVDDELRPACLRLVATLELLVQR